MPSDYERIYNDNIKEYGEGTRHLEFLGRLYPDRTHFLFELLQNAEDAAGRSDDGSAPIEVRFDLFRDRLELRHNGCPFNEKDVRGICGVGEGTKAGDLTQIGKFGVGFKSVYTYTKSPEIHSGEEHFRIEDYVRPHAAEKREPGNTWTTLIVLSFNHSELKPEQAFAEISSRLKALNARTLLFLRHLQSIHWQVEGGDSGSYRREQEDSEQLRQLKEIDRGGKPRTVEEWLVFEKPLPDRTARVEVAFLLRKNEKTGEKSIDRVQDSQLVVFFPTETETHLGFLIQGPYRTTPARDNIPKDDEWNRGLIDMTATLVAESLTTLRDRKLLTISLLKSLPIKPVNFQPNSMFRAVFKRVRDVLKTQDLLPTHDGGFVSANRAKLARSAVLRELLSQEQLRDLLGGGESHWLADTITPDRTSELWSYLREELRVEAVTPASFLGLVKPAFLDRQPDEWMVQFYCFLDQQRGLWTHDCPLRNRPLIRREDGAHVPAFRDEMLPNIYLPPEEETSFPTVKRSIIADRGALAFLVALGLKMPDIVAEVREKILPKYVLWSPETRRIVREAGVRSNEENWQDIQKILRAVNEANYVERSDIKKDVYNRAWLRVKRACDGAELYWFPLRVYIPSPDVKMYFTGNPDAFFLADDYSNEQCDEIGKFLSRVVRVNRRKADVHGYIIVANDHGRHVRSLDGFDPKCKIDGLMHALKNITLEKAIFIWNELLIPNWRQVRGFVESSTRQTFANCEREERLSDLGQKVTENRWLPDREGNFHIPAELLLDDLPDEFKRNEDLALALQMRSPPELDQIARDLGLKKGDIEFIRKNPKAFGEFRQAFEKKQVGNRDRDSLVKPTDAPTKPDERKATVDVKPTEHPKPPQQPPAAQLQTRRPVKLGQVKPKPEARIDHVDLFDENDEACLKRAAEIDREKAEREGPSRPGGDGSQTLESTEATATEPTEVEWQVMEIHPLFIPYSPRKFGVCHFLGGRSKIQDAGWRSYVKEYLRSARAYDRFLENLENPDRHGLPLNSHLKRACQIEKDEKFWLAGALLRCFYSVDRQKSFAKLLSLCEHAKPPKQLGSWEECLSGDPGKIYLFFEAPLPSPQGFREWLQRELYGRQVVPYVIYAGHDCKTKKVGINLEGTTKVDALLLNANNGFSVLFEAKILSDISGQVTYDSTRNQIARNIDAMLYQDENPNKPVSLRGKRRPELSCFVLLTPRLFKDHPESRLYGLLLPEYQKDGSALRRDISWRETAKELLDDVSTRIDWLTWEAIHERVGVRDGHGICPWLDHFKYGPTEI